LPAAGFRHHGHPPVRGRTASTESVDLALVVAKLQNAASIAGLILTTEALVSEIKEKAPAVPSASGMDGMY
jgi:hypothetical protein